MSTKVISNQPYDFRSYMVKLIKNSFLIHVLTKRELKVKYSRTFIGIGWVILQPLLVVTVYTIFFKNLIKLNTEEIPYPQFVLTGLVLWYLFTGIVSKCSYALIESSDLINKVSFPRIIILLAKCIPVIVECLALLIIAFSVLLFTRQNIGIYALTSIFYFVQTVILSFSIGILCSIIVLKYRDLGHAIPFVINFGIWLTPVFYSVNIIPEQYKNLYLYLNPLALSINGLREGVFHSTGITHVYWILFVVSFILLLISLLIFIKSEKNITENL